MPLTGLFLLPIQPSQSSPLSTLISHITRSFPATPLPPFTLDHRLFVDTSSLLPNSDTSLRRYTQVLTLPHDPSKTYIGTSAPKTPSADLAQITIPSSSSEAFTTLINSKLQPQWAHRQSLVVENGISISLRDEEWTLRCGDLRVPPRANQTGGVLRGVLFEVSSRSTTSEGNEKDDEALLRAFLDALLDGTGIKLDGARVSIRTTEPVAVRHGSASTAEDDTTISPHWKLANLYMEVLRGSRA